jgi:hypothetical protein
MLVKVRRRNSTELMSSLHLHVRLSCSASAELLVMRLWRNFPGPGDLAVSARQHHAQEPHAWFLRLCAPEPAARPPRATAAHPA